MLIYVRRSCVWRVGEERSLYFLPSKNSHGAILFRFLTLCSPVSLPLFPTLPKKILHNLSLLFRAIQFSPCSSYKLNFRPSFKKCKPSGEPFLKNNHKVLHSVLVLNNDILPLQISSNMCPKWWTSTLNKS